MPRANANGNKKGSGGKGSHAAKAPARGLRANSARAAAPDPQFEPLMGDSAARDITGIVLAVVAVVSFIAVVSPTTAPVSNAISGFYHLGFGLGAYVLPFALLIFSAGLFAVVSFIAVVSPTTAPVSNAISGFYHLGFGLGAYVLPFALLIFSAGLFLRDRAPLNARTLAGGGLILLCILSMLSLLVPGTEFSTAGMFESHALSSSGGYVGAFIASALQKALGKTISMVVLVGLIVVGLVIIGFSVCRPGDHRILRERLLPCGG